MLFADVALAARIERADCRLLGDCAAAAARRRPDSRVFFQELAGGVATYTGPGSPFNKLAGLGFAGAVDEAHLAGVERALADRGTPVQAEVANLADPSVCALLTRRGYVLQNFENVLGMRLPAAHLPDVGAGIKVSAADERHHEAWLDIVVTGFANPDTQGVPSHEDFPREVIERAVGDLATASGFARYLAYRDGVVAGGASLRVCDGFAQLCGAATAPSHRRHGVQSALLAARLTDAARQGCDIVVVTTQPGIEVSAERSAAGFRATLHACDPGAGGVRDAPDASAEVVSPAASSACAPAPARSVPTRSAGRGRPPAPHRAGLRPRPSVKITKSLAEIRNIQSSSCKHC